jgi:hypothetical protein
VLGLLRDREATAAMGRRAETFCRERFDIRRCAEEYVAIFEELGNGG